MSSNNKKDDEPEQDPYEVLGVPATASDADISKAFKKLALKLHPDKQQQQQKAGIQRQDDATEEAFHAVQWAKSFLLDAEFAPARRKYDARRASLRARQAADVARTSTMSERRKRMREELQRQEQEASAALKRRGVATSSSSRTSSTSRKEEKKRYKADYSKRSSRSKTTSNKEDAANLERLRRQGNEMREAYADRQEEEAAAAASSRASRRGESKNKYDLVEESDEHRQVRLKWSRRKMGKKAVTEISLMQLLKERCFGDIERVELLGKKGNAALVTFVNASSCRPCVDALQDSDEMRATFVGKRKNEEEAVEAAAAAAAARGENTLDQPTSSNHRDVESVADWKLRRAAEREELLRQVEREDDDEDDGDDDENDEQHDKSRGQTTKRATASAAASTVIFPPHLPKPDNSTNSMNKETISTTLSPLELLEKAEAEILVSKSGILSSQEMQRLREGQVV